MYNVLTQQIIKSDIREVNVCETEKFKIFFKPCCI